jgi:hypothetical protein
LVLDEVNACISHTAVSNVIWTLRNYFEMRARLVQMVDSVPKAMVRASVHNLERCIFIRPYVLQCQVRTFVHHLLFGASQGSLDCFPENLVGLIIISNTFLSFRLRLLLLKIALCVAMGRC